MKKKGTIREQLGITQQDMAALLKISRGQWSMYESGKRNLPTAATILMSEMLAYMKTSEAELSNKLQQQETNTKQALEKLLKENEYQLALTARKVTAMKKKQEANMRALQLSAFLALPATTKAINSPEIINMIAVRATKNLGKNNQNKLTLLQLQEAMLWQQREWLKATLDK